MDKQKLFVGNLNFAATEADVNQLFSVYGTVKNIRLQQKRGCAFVEMSSAEEAASAIQNLDHKDFMDRPLRISLELTKKQAKAVARARIKENAKLKLPANEQ